MKTKKIFLSFMILFAMTSFLSAQEKKDSKETVVFKVDIDCNSCKNKIEKNIPFEKGVKAMDIDMEKNTVTITYDSKKTDIAKLQEGFKKIGKEAEALKPACCEGKSECKKSSSDEYSHGNEKPKCCK